MLRWLGLAAVLAVSFAACAAAADSTLGAAWVQYGPDGVEARAVVSGNTCPAISIDGRDRNMQPRAGADAQFQLVCSLPIPPGARTAALVIGNPPDLRTVPLPLPVADPQRIVVFGDSGCRIKGSTVQDCSDSSKWPFPEIAAEAARLKPDLVIHVGDYLYRESACPANAAGCAGTPWGDNWPTWDADFFAPAQPLLAAAPWVIVRGNHEECSRAGPGWLRLLGPLPYDPAAACAAHVAPYAVPLGGFGLVVMDDANAPDESVAADLVPVYRNELASLADTKGPAWLVLHRPIWAAISGPLGMPIGGNATLIAAAGTSGIPSPVELMLAGHIHTFEALNYDRDDHVPPQVVAGFGGDLLDPTPPNLRGTIFQGDSGVRVTDGLSIGGFGFLLMTRTNHGWRIEVHDRQGRIERECVFQADRVACPRRH